MFTRRFVPTPQSEKCSTETISFLWTSKRQYLGFAVCNAKMQYLLTAFWLCRDVYKYCFTSLSVQSWQYRDRRKPEAGTMPYSYFEWLQGFFIVHNTLYSALYTPCLWTVWSTVYAQPRWQISVPTGIRTWYPQVTSPSRYEWAIGAGLAEM